MKRRKPTLTLTLLAAAILLLVALAPAASAKDRVYFSNAGPLAFMSLDGTGPGSYVELVDPDGYSPPFTGGLALDPAANKFYVTESAPGPGLGGILVGELADLADARAVVTHLPTGGATVASPFGAALDPPANRIYWANLAGTISYANLDGSGGGDLNTSGATVDQPFGVALDPTADRIYWGNYNGDTISYANLDGSGGGDLNTGGATVDGPTGVAIAPAKNRIYWANVRYFGTELDGTPGTISYANLDGTGGGDDLDTTGATVVGPRGLALDPAENRIYWANPGKGTIAFANLDGTGDGGELEIAGFPGGLFPVFPALLKEPSATERPEISEGNGQSGAAASAKGVVGRRLSCSEGRWSEDLLGGFSYRAPHSFAYRWLQDGAKIPGATGKSFTPKKTGSHRCRVTASNEAGSSSQKSHGVEVASPSACKKAKKKLKKAKKKLKKAKKSGNAKKLKKAKKKVKKAKKGKKKAC